MTLKEKFKVLNCTDCDMPYCDTKCTILSTRELETLEKIADEFAIEVLEFYHNGLFFIPFKDGEAKEILNYIKKEKSL